MPPEETEPPSIQGWLRTCSNYCTCVEGMYVDWLSQLHNITALHLSYTFFFLQTSLSHSTRSAWRTPPSSDTTASHLSATTADATTRPSSSRRGHLRHSQAVAAHFPQQVAPETTPSSPSERNSISSSYGNSSSFANESMQPRTVMAARSSGLASILNYTQPNQAESSSNSLHSKESNSSRISTFSSGTLSTVHSTQNTSSQALSLSSMSTTATTVSTHRGPEHQSKSLPKVGRAGVENTFTKPQTLFRTAGQLSSNRCGHWLVIFLISLPFVCTFTL